MKHNPHAIPGIHNYCDRWCERCSFTSRCDVYEITSDLTPEERDIHNKAFWDRLSKNFEGMIEMIREAAAKHGIDLTSFTPEEENEYQAGKKRLEDIRENHPLTRMSWEYVEKALEWLKKIPSIEEKEEELNKGLTLGILTKEEAMTEAASLKDCLEIIQWYIHFIYLKLVRALMGKAEYDGWEEQNGFQRDFDGSAKIALIATDRTMQAWLMLMNTFPSQEDTFLNFLSTLQKIRTLTEKEFPNAWNFVRPGFDE